MSDKVRPPRPSDAARLAPTSKVPYRLSKWAIIVTMLTVIYYVYSWLDRIKDRWYVFEPEALHQLAKAAIANSPDDTAAMIDYIVTNLTATYSPNQIRLNTHQEWVFNNAGGAMGAMYIIHASITEYLIIFGTPLGTEGHTGYYPADNRFHILKGEQWVFEPGSLEMQRFRPGDRNLTPRGVVRQYKMHKGCWALEYARGWIPGALPFGMADTLTSTLDVPTFYNTARITGREMIGNLLIGKI
ncbi:ERG2/sigma1 receptor-like protein [Panaeolus papilionaceus]|nr:ERG2/sigma1 receptor-like protein [Panaeolus papilionaceus]